DTAAGYELLSLKLRQGTGLAKMREIISGQGGLAAVVDHPELLPRATRQVAVKSSSGGFVQAIRANELGWACILLGAGRLKKDDQVDPAVGIILTRKLGDRVESGDTLAILHVNREDNLMEAQERLAGSFLIGPAPPEIPPLIYEIIS
ncbi:MAG: pyrimidine-nucleoside phosphorylase, partial [Thermacetogeniaceae bacterium]